MKKQTKKKDKILLGPHKLKYKFLVFLSGFKVLGEWEAQSVYGIESTLNSHTPKKWIRSQINFAKHLDFKHVDNCWQIFLEENNRVHYDFNE